MKTVKDKIITERVLLKDCKPGDRVDISSYLRGSLYGLQSLILIKIKSIGGGKIQIKYKSVYRNQPKIHKADLLDTTMVTLHRKATRSDFESDDVGTALVVPEPITDFRQVRPIGEQISSPSGGVEILDPLPPQKVKDQSVGSRRRSYGGFGILLHPGQMPFDDLSGSFFVDTGGGKNLSFEESLKLIGGSIKPQD